MIEEKDKYSYVVIGKAMEAHRELGPGLDEIFYHELLSAKLKAAGIPHRFKPKGQLIHRGLVADEFEADLIVGDELVLELKVLWDAFTPENLLQIICYLKFWKLRAGLLFDFGKESLVHKRVVFVAPDADFGFTDFINSAPAGIKDKPALVTVGQSIARILAEHGLGYRDTTYRGLIFADLQAEGIPCVREPVTAVCSAAGLLGETKFNCLVLPGQCALHVTALRDTRQAADRAVLQTYLRHLGLPWGLVINFGKQRLDYQYVVQLKPTLKKSPL